jgi:hypothetical protein
MPRRAAIFIFGVLPATWLSLMLTEYIFVGGVKPISFRGWFLTLSPIYELAGLGGTVALWIIAFRKGALVRGRREGIIVGIMLLLGLAVAWVPLMIPAWWSRYAALSTIVTALLIFPSIWRAIRMVRL